MKRAAAVVLALVCVVTGVADAGAEGGIGGTNNTELDQTGAVESSATAVYVEGALGGSGSVNPFEASSGSDLTAVIAPAYVEPPCLRYEFQFEGTDASGVSVGTTVCVEQLTCGYERVDDPLSGRFSGSDGSGRFAQYLGELGSAAAPLAGTSPGTPGSDISGSVLAAGLGDAPDDEAMPVMRWCARQNGSLVLIDDTWGVGFSWDLADVHDSYPIDAVRVSLIEEVRARVQTYEPIVETVPPLASGHTFVKFPTWLWVQDPLTAVSRYAVNDRETVRVEIRATLVDAVFTLGDRDVRCEVDDMVVYDADRHHAIDDAPACSTIFDDVGDRVFDTTMTYRIEERIAFSANRVFPDEAWQPHPTVAELQRTSSLGSFGVHQLLSLVVNEEQ